MSFEDPNFGALFPVRTGVAIGSSDERKMLDAVGGAQSFRTRIQKDASTGLETMLRTRNGMPEFTTRSVITQSTVVDTLYMESGQLEWSFPGEGNSTRYDPAKWHFLDISTFDDYLGTIKKTAPTIGIQQNVTALFDGQDSLSIGYPHGATTTEESANKAAYSDALVIKKIVAGLFPASLFSGKMRLFLQAKYGAKQSTSTNELIVDIVGTSAVLKYSTAGRSLQLGLWANNSPGIFTAPDGSWWLLTINGHVQYLVTAYRVIVPSSVEALRQEYLLAVLSADYRSKIEAYIFAYSTIDVSNPYLLGEFTGAKGSAMAYGWKWNSDGSRASIVVHEVLGTGVADMRWKASTMHLSVSYSNTGTISATNFSISATVETHGEWTDGWGTFNIFTPDDEASRAPLSLYSLAIERLAVKPRFSFSEISVYGWYKDDVWQPIVLGRTIDATTGFRQEDSGIMYVDSSSLTLSSRYQFGYVYSDQEWTYESHDISSSDAMSVCIGDDCYNGTGEYGSHYYVSRTHESTGTISNPVSWSPVTTSPSHYSPGTNPAGYFSYATQVETGRISITYESFTGTENMAWALVIPCCDSCSAYVAKQEYIATDLYRINIEAGTGVLRFIKDGASYAAYNDPNGHSGWYGITPDRTSTLSYDSPQDSTTYVSCFNEAISAFAGTPSASYYGLFNVDMSYPYFDAGMYAYSSYGKRYVMSEGPKYPESVNKDHCFVGWV